MFPTILDLLVEREIFSKCKATAAHDLLGDYEGQSLLRTRKNAPDGSEYSGWQFTIMNPGGSSLAVRNAD